MKVVSILIFGVLVYLIWALAHHRRDKSLTLPIFLEYLLIAALALVIVMAAFLS